MLVLFEWSKQYKRTVVYSSMYEQGEHLYLVTGTAKETVRDGLLCSAIEKPVQVVFQQQPLSWKPINKQTDKKNQRRLKSRYISRGAISKQRV